MREWVVTSSAAVGLASLILGELERPIATHSSHINDSARRETLAALNLTAADIVGTLTAKRILEVGDGAMRPSHAAREHNAHDTRAPHLHVSLLAARLRTRWLATVLKHPRTWCPGCSPDAVFGTSVSRLRPLAWHK